jgi:hypothetical protein
MHKLRYFFLNADTDTHRANKKLLVNISSRAEKLFSFPSAIQLFHEDTVKPELLEYVSSDLPEQVQMESFITELDTYLNTVIELMTLIQVTQVQNFDALGKYISTLSIIEE